VLSPLAGEARKATAGAGTERSESSHSVMKRYKLHVRPWSVKLKDEVLFDLEGVLHNTPAPAASRDASLRSEYAPIANPCNDEFEWDKITKCLETGNCILVASGAFGEVSRLPLSCTGNDNTYVAKIVPMTPQACNEKKFNELIQRNDKHPAIQRVLLPSGVFVNQKTERPYLVLLFPEMDRSLRDRLREGRCMSLEAVARILLDLLEALEFIHFEMKFIHDDLKPENILLHDGYARICDFGSSTEGSANSSRNDKKIRHKSDIHTGTILYMSFERLRCEEYGTNADIFSLGIVIVEMFILKPLTPPEVDGAVWCLCDSLITAYEKGWNPSQLLTRRYDPFKTYELAFMCLCMDESKRKSSTECLEHYRKKMRRMPSRESVCAEMSGSCKGGWDKAMQVLHFCIYATAVVGFFLSLCWAFCS